MPRQRPPHPADAANADIVANAVRFSIALFMGAGRYEYDHAETLDEAKAKARQLEAAFPNGRRALIYGVNAAGRSGLVTDDLLNPKTKETEDMATKAKAKASKAKASKKPTAKSAAAKPNGNAAKAKPLGKRAAIEAAAREGKMPSPPDFSAETHKRFCPKLAEVVEMAKAGNLKGLRAWKYQGFMSTSPKAIQRYRDLAILALAAKEAK